MKNFKKDLATNITLICVLVFSCIHLLILTLNLFGATNLEFGDNFNYIFAYFLVVLSLALYILSFTLIKYKRWFIPSWLKILFFVAFFVFTNVYYITGAFANIFADVLMFVYLGFLISIISVSLFYNAQKDEKNRLKSTQKYIVTSIVMFSLAISFVVEFLAIMVKCFFIPDFVLSTLPAIVAEAGTLLLTTVIMAILFNLSLSKTKKFINSCLIKHVPQNAISRSVKDKD